MRIKERSIMTISQQLCVALDDSKQVILDAEDFLRKMPGRFRIELDVSRIFGEDEGTFLAFIDDKLVVITRIGGFNIDGEVESFDVPRRLELIKRIPEFMGLVQHAEPEMVNEFQSAIAQIRSAIQGNNPRRTLRVRTDDDLLQVLAQQASTSWVVAKGMETEIAQVEIVNFAGTQMIEGDFDPASERESNGRLVARFTNGRIVNCQIDFGKSQNPVS